MLNRKVVVLLASIAGVYGALLYWTWFTDAGRMDACLDRGGRWLRDRGECYAPPTP